MRGSIPPANRQRGSLRQISSMLSATRVGFTFVGPALGGGIGSASRAPAKEPEYKPKVIAPDPEAHRQREAMREAVVQALADSVSFWAEELAKWTEEFGEIPMRKLKEQMEELEK